MLFLTAVLGRVEVAAREGPEEGRLQAVIETLDGAFEDYQALNRELLAA